MDQLFTAHSTKKFKISLFPTFAERLQHLLQQRLHPLQRLQQQLQYLAVAVQTGILVMVITNNTIFSPFLIMNSRFLLSKNSNLETQTCEPQPEDCPDLPINWLGSKYTTVKMKG